MAKDELSDFLASGEPTTAEFFKANIKDGFDPEKGSAASQGASVPYTSTLLFGLEVTF